MTLLDAARQALEALEVTARQPVGARTIEAILALRQAIEQAEQDSVTRNGWVLREVLFDNGEPVGHREPEQKPLMDEADVLMLAEAHGIDAATVGLYSFYVDCMSTTPPQRKPLTDLEIDRLWIASPPTELEGIRFRHIRFAKMIERAHGIGSEK